MKSLKYDHVYLFRGANGIIHKGQYTGKQEGFPCMICNKGNSGYTFNIWHTTQDYETFSYGREHFPEILEDLGPIEFDEDGEIDSKFIDR